MANTFSNLFTVLLSLGGTYVAFKEGMPSRYVVGLLVCKLSLNVVEDKPSNMWNTSRESRSLPLEAFSSMQHCYLKHSWLMNFL